MLYDLKDVKYGRVAQLVEQCPFKAWVAGSNPAALTMISKYLADFGRVDFGHPRTPRASETLVSTQLPELPLPSVSPEIPTEPPFQRLCCGLAADPLKRLVRKALA